MFKFAKYIEYALLGLGLVFTVLFYVQSGSGIFKLSNLTDALSSTTMLDGVLLWAYILIAVALLLVIVLSVAAMIQNPKSLKKTGFILGLSVVLIVASYFLASGAPVEANVAKAPTFAQLKMTDTLLVLTYILLGATVLVLVGGSVANAVRKR